MFFFFKQKTAYEMRISDWSSDVCSSDLGRGGAGRHPHHAGRHHRRSHRLPLSAMAQGHGRRRLFPEGFGRDAAVAFRNSCPLRHSRRRSEEHTSELQSLMRISYAVFCLKKKKKDEIEVAKEHTIQTTKAPNCK